MPEPTWTGPTYRTVEDQLFADRSDKDVSDRELARTILEIVEKTCSRPSPAEEEVERVRQRLISLIFQEAQPDRGDIFSWFDDRAEMLARAAIAAMSGQQPPSALGAASPKCEPENL